jgi:outer membrane lipoprotein-sorting protein
MKAISHLTSAVILYIVFMASPLRAEEDPRAIFEKAADQMVTDKMELSMHVETTEQNGRLTEKDYDILIGRFGEVEKTRMIMQKPERAKGITVVITSLPQETGVIEVFTPSNGKVRKMKATPENMARFGSSMVLSGYSSQDVDDLNVTLAGSGDLEGRPCFLLDVEDKSEAEGMKARFMVEESTYRLLKILFFDQEGNNTGLATLSDFQPVPGMKGKMLPMHIVAEDFTEKMVTSMQLLKVTPRPDLKEEEFTLEESNE